ncbi:MAG: class I SAM-dependent methyltransferase [Phycisphaerae bacterium]|nr:class I SAM-dependent methyltransferase [Phycisphaerae bacterium]
MDQELITNQQIYDQVLADGRLHGQIGPRDINRFKDTLRHLDKNSRSILDVGCHAGDWLHYVLTHRSIRSHLGIDVVPGKIDEARRRFPDLNVRVSFAEQLDVPEKAFDTVTCMEVLEHILDWLGVFQSLFSLARRQVLVTVPYREEIVQTVCIHCARLTPLYGHLRTYTEDSFPAVPGWTRSFARIRERDPGRSFAYRCYRRIKPHYPWLIADYRAG